MRQKIRIPVERATMVTVQKVIESLGIELIMWAKTIEETDPNDSYEVFMEIRDDMAANSEMLLAVLKSFPKLLAKMKMPVPEHMEVFTIPNPLNGRVEQDIPPEGGKSSSDSEGVLPF